MCVTIDNCIVNVTGGDIPREELTRYVSRGRDKYAAALHSIDIAVDGDYVGITYHYSDKPFERIRRITGYLVGTLDRFNDAKRAEERDRVKHSI